MGKILPQSFWWFLDPFVDWCYPLFPCIYYRMCFQRRSSRGQPLSRYCPLCCRHYHRCFPVLPGKASHLDPYDPTLTSNGKCSRNLNPMQLWNLSKTWYHNKPLLFVEVKRKLFWRELSSLVILSKSKAVIVSQLIWELFNPLIWKLITLHSLVNLNHRYDVICLAGQ